MRWLVRPHQILSVSQARTILGVELCSNIYTALKALPYRHYTRGVMNGSNAEREDPSTSVYGICAYCALRDEPKHERFPFPCPKTESKAVSLTGASLYSADKVDTEIDYGFVHLCRVIPRARPKCGASFAIAKCLSS